MERIKVLADQLVKQVEISASLPTLLHTVRMLQAELETIMGGNNIEEQRKGVTVILPKATAFIKAVQPFVDTEKVLFKEQEPKVEETEDGKIILELNLDEDMAVAMESELEIAADKAAKELLFLKEQEEAYKEGVIENESREIENSAVVPEQGDLLPVEGIIMQEAVATDEPAVVKEEAPPTSSGFKVEEIPTLFPYYTEGAKSSVEEEPQLSFNERMQQQYKDEGVKMMREPIQDLRKAIGINDRFMFINELFRGDEVMYERSIKTINGFNVLSEAEYWINRELKIKLGWLSDNGAVKLFDQLVKRRFS